MQFYHLSEIFVLTMHHTRTIVNFTVKFVVIARVWLTSQVIHGSEIHVMYEMIHDGVKHCYDAQQYKSLLMTTLSIIDILFFIFFFVFDIINYSVHFVFHH